MCLCYIEKKETGIGTQTATHLNNGLHILTFTPLITLCPSPSPPPTSKLHTLQFQLKQATGRRLCISCCYSLLWPHSCPETHLHVPHSLLNLYVNRCPQSVWLLSHSRLSYHPRGSTHAVPRTLHSQLALLLVNPRPFLDPLIHDFWHYLPCCPFSHSLMSPTYLPLFFSACC